MSVITYTLALSFVVMFLYRFIKKADKKILNQIISLYIRQGWWEKGDCDELYKKIIKNSHCFLIVIKNKKIIGMGRAISDRINDAYIQDVAILKPWRNLGIGSEIIKRIVRRLKKDKIKWIGLVAQDNSTSFYKKLGFKLMKNSNPMIYPVK